MVLRWTGLTIDCTDPVRLAQFWARLLDRPVTDEMTGPGWASVGSRLDHQPRLTFQRVPDERRGKVRIHIDISVDDIDDARRAIEADGGTWAGERYEHDAGTVLTMRDPEGNEFCIAQYR